MKKRRMIIGYGSFGEAARTARENAKMPCGRRKMSREEAAFNLGVTNKTLYHYELNITPTPPGIARRMAELYEAPWLRELYYQVYLLGDIKKEAACAAS